MSNRLAPKKRTLGRKTSGFKYLTLFQCCGTVLTVSSLPHVNNRGLENFNDIRQGTFTARGLTTGGKTYSANGS